MSKKMWNKIFKSKSQKQQQQLNKINKRHSRGIFEEYQQLNELLVGEKVENGCNENAPPNGNGNEYGNRNVSGNGNGKGNINVFQQPPQRSSFNSSSLSEAQQQQQQQQQQQTQRQHHLSTFSRVCNTFSLRRNSSNNNNNIINNKQPPNAKSSITDSDNNECGDGEDIDVPPPGPLTTGYSIPISEDPFDSAKPTDLTPCPNCSRTFNLNALRKHVAICEKTSKKRKLFDSSRQRREGTSLSTYVLPKNFGLPNAEKAAGVHSPPLSSRDTAQPEVSTPLPTRRNSKAKAQRKTSNSEGGAGGGASSSAAAPASSSSGAPAAPALDRRDPKRSSDRPKRSIKDTASDRCPHCDRTFNPKAFDRHVEWCKEKAVQAAIKAANSTETAKAKERLDARKQYKPPNLKTKRSMNRDKYSHHEELLEAGEMMAPKPSLMTLSSMTSSVHSENPEIKAVQQPATPRLEGRRGRRGSITTVTENSVKLQMANDEEPEPPSPPPPQRAATLQSRSKRHQHANDTCDGVDQTISRIRRAASREALQLAKLDNDNKTEIVPRASTGKLRKAQSNNEKLDMIEAMSAETNQVTMRFDELNGLIKRKEMDEPELKISTKSRSSTSLVRQARRRPRTREHPSLEMRAIAGELGSSSDLRAQKTTESLEIDNNDQMVPLQRVARDRVMYSGSEDEGAEIQIKLETTTTRTLCRPKKRSNKLPQLTGSAEPMKALPMPQLKQSLEVLGHNISQAQLPRLDIGNERLEEDDLDNDSISDELEEMEVVAPAKSSAKNRQIKSRTISRTRNNCTPELLEDQERQIKSRTISRTMKARSPEDLSLDQEDLEPIKLPPLVKQGSNVSRRLVLLEEDENGTMYIKDAPSAGNNQTLESSRSRTSGGGGRNRVKRCDSSDEKLMRQQSNVSSISSHENDKEKRMADQQKREIFISIETEANAQGRSPISPDSLRHMVGNPQTKIDVLHIDNGNEPEHAKFSKISDTEEADSDLRFDDKVKQQQSQLTSSSNLLGANATPNVQLNNAKNLIQQMQSEFRQLGEDASASMRRAMLRTEESSTKEREREVAQQKPEQIVTATSSHSGDSDEFSSLDGYPMSSSQSSRREGANSKLSSDSAYGSSNSPYSLSRQRSSELAANSPRSGPLLRPHTANAKLMDASTQAQTAYGTLKARQRLFAGGAAGDGNPDGAESSSSASDNSVHHKNNNKQQPQQQQQQISNYNYQQQQQQQSPHNSNNNNLLPTPTTSQQSLASSNSSMSSSMKMSKFCHECGGKFVLEHAKFCMECGVRRVVL
ncbi:formin-J isoform X4 [Drosophila willistoni]|uniref:formin-J isoform X4 n=1 Tax=Drosophila willistoni TaxID=7260 RepID=UPI001F084DD7|nr:formin-J isoform X4 [Drosophila willistoni]